MWFIADRDERDDSDVDRMFKMLGDRARLHVLQRRELENYLLDPTAVVALLNQKINRIGDDSVSHPTIEELRAALDSVASALRSEVVRLLMAKRLLGPIHLLGRNIEGSIEERLNAAIQHLEERKNAIASTRAEIEIDVDMGWTNAALSKAPGTLVLESVMKKFGSSFSKDGGDSARLARLLHKNSIPKELSDLLTEIAAS